MTLTFVYTENISSKIFRAGFHHADEIIILIDEKKLSRDVSWAKRRVG